MSGQAECGSSNDGDKNTWVEVERKQSFRGWHAEYQPAHFPLLCQLSTFKHFEQQSWKDTESLGLITFLKLGMGVRV